MKVLGLSPLDEDATVSFVENGRVVFACGEERLSRVKLQDGFRHIELPMEVVSRFPIGHARLQRSDAQRGTC